jgi:hypothetical protein
LRFHTTGVTYKTQNILFLAFIACLSIVQAQESVPAPAAKKGLYFSWGYTRAKYSKSTIEFRNHSNQYNPVTNRFDNYDFTIHDAVAHDRPDFDKIPDVINITVPQYVFRIGYVLSKKWGIELNYDHTKYVVDNYQRVRVEGVFNDLWVDNDTILDPDSFLHFEHSDGANFWMINLVRSLQLVDIKNKFTASWVVKPGGGVVVPRTDVTLFGERLNNWFKVAGWIVGVETGLRLTFLRHGFFEFVGKGVYADYVNAFVLGKGHGRASHHFFAGQLTATLGLKFYSKTPLATNH